MLVQLFSVYYLCNTLTHRQNYVQEKLEYMETDSLNPLKFIQQDSRTMNESMNFKPTYLLLF